MLRGRPWLLSGFDIVTKGPFAMDDLMDDEKKLRAWELTRRVMKTVTRL